MSIKLNRWLNVTANVAKGIAIVLTGLTLVALIAMRASNSVNPATYAGLARYREADAQLAAVSGANRIVFFGDSITDLWDLQKFFPNLPYVNRGIFGQTTPQMVLRFHQDVVDLKPGSVVILAGINDIRAGIPVDQTEANYAAVSEMARANRIAVYFGSVLPVGESRRGYPKQKIAALNQWLRDYCKNNAAVYVDYWSHMADGNGFLLTGLSLDGIHPNARGYAVMQSVLAAAISGPAAVAAKAEVSK